MKKSEQHTNEKVGAKPELALSPEQIESVRDWSHSLLDGYWQTNQVKRVDSFSTQDKFLHELANLVDAEDDYKKRIVKFPLAPAVTIFIEELFLYCEEKSSNPEEAKQYQKFLWNVHQHLLSVSPSIFNYQLFIDQMKTAATATRVPEFNHVVGQNFEGELLYQFAFMERESAQYFAEQASSWSTGEILDIFHLLQSLATEAAVNDDWSEDAQQNTAVFMQRVCEIRKQPILNLAMENAFQYISDASATENFSLIPGGGRSPDLMEMQDFFDQARLEQSIEPRGATEGSMLPIAKDAIAVFDTSGLPRSVARFELASAKPKIAYLPRSIEQAKKLVERRPRHPQEFLELIGKVAGSLGVSMIRMERNDIDLLKPAEGIDIVWDGAGFHYNESKNLDYKDVGTALHEMSDLLTAEEWTTLLRNGNAINEMIDAAYARIEQGEDEGKVNEELFASPTIVATEKILTKLDDNYDKFSDAVVRATNHLLAIASEKLQKIDFRPFSAITQDSDMIPFGSDSPKTLAILLEQMQRPSLRRSAEQSLGIKLNDIPLRSQIHLLRFLSSQNEETFSRLASVLQKPETNKKLILESFLANAEDEKYALAIVSLAEQVPSNSLETVLNKYREIVEVADGIDMYLARAFANSKTLTQSNRTEIARQLLHRGNELLLSLVDTKKEPEEILQQLENIKSDIIRCGAIFKVAAREGKVSLEDMTGIERITRDSSEITPTERAEMIHIYRANRPKYSPELLQLTLKKFQEAVDAPGKEFHILKKDGVIAAFFRLDRLDEKTLYFASFNVRPEAQGLTIGPAFMSQMITEKGSFNNLKLDVYSKNPIIPTYEKLGFVKTGEIPDYGGTGELFYKMERPATRQMGTKTPEKLAA